MYYLLPVKSRCALALLAGLGWWACCRCWHSEDLQKRLPAGNEVQSAWAGPGIFSTGNSRTDSRQSVVIKNQFADCRLVISVTDPRPGLGLPADVIAAESNRTLEFAIPGRRIPSLVPRRLWQSPQLVKLAVPLPEANTLAPQNYAAGHLACLERRTGERSFINPEMLLLKFGGQPLLTVVRVEAGLELEALNALAARDDVEFVQPDVLQRRCFQPDDPLVGNQWHHTQIGSFAAWDYSRTGSPVRVAIVDTPFQMDHPDLIANTMPGWDAVANQPVTASAGVDHSTMAAGLITATLNNASGVAGVANCKILPINVTGFESELCNAVYWAATNGVRVVNISWTGAGSAALNAAGNYLKTQSQGILVMSGENGTGDLGLPNQPDIWVVAMTDAADNQRCKYGVANDFAAPGWAVYSTLAGSRYGFGTGTSYAAPVLAGAVAQLLSINPVLSPDAVQDIIRSTARDFGDPGWDLWFGWGRIDVGAAAAEAFARLPRLQVLGMTPNQMTIATGVRAGFACQVWRGSITNFSEWTLVSPLQLATNNDELIATVPVNPGPGSLFRISVGQ